LGKAKTYTPNCEQNSDVTKMSEAKDTPPTSQINVFTAWRWAGI